jgi:hypothetical protein
MKRRGFLGALLGLPVTPLLAKQIERTKALPNSLPATKGLDITRKDVDNARFYMQTTWAAPSEPIEYAMDIPVEKIAQAEFAKLQMLYASCYSVTLSTEAQYVRLRSHNPIDLSLLA